MSANCWPSESCVPFSSSVPCLPSPPAHPPAPVACFLFKYFELHFWEGWVEQMLSNWQCLKFWELLPPKLASKENHECWNFDQDQKLPPLRQSLWKSPLNLKDTAILCQVAILSLETLLPGLNKCQCLDPDQPQTSRCFFQSRAPLHPVFQLSMERRQSKSILFRSIVIKYIFYTFWNWYLCKAPLC